MSTEHICMVVLRIMKEKIKRKINNKNSVKIIQVLFLRQINKWKG